MPTYYVETYPSDGNYPEPATTEHDTLDAAMADASSRLGRSLPGDPEWVPDADMVGPNIPADARPVGAWHENDLELCGGVAIWVKMVDEEEEEEEEEEETEEVVRA